MEPAAAPAENKMLMSHVPCGAGARKGAKDHQEDSYTHFSSPNNKVVIGGIWDGHGGYNGHLASTCARDTSLHYWEQHKSAMESWSQAEWTKQLQELFALCHEKIRQTFLDQVKDSQTMRRTVVEGIVRSHTGDPVHGGTTATVVVSIRPDTPDGKLTVITANTGDSTALLINLKDVPETEKLVYLSVDHGPESDIEYNRVQSLPASEYPTKLLFVYDKTNVFKKFECPTVFGSDGKKDQKFVKNPWGNGLHPTNVRYEPAVYAVTPREVKKDSTCIAMTRALGDFYAHQFGLTAIPSITTNEVSADGDYCLLAGSDGIWDCWRYEDFARFVSECINAKRLSAIDLSEEVLNESIKKAVANFGARHYDDASFVCWRMCPGAKSEIEWRQNNP